MYPYPPPQPAPPPRNNGVRPLAVVLIAVGSMLFGCIGGAAITSAPTGDPASSSAPVTVTATPSASPAPTMDANAQDMCAKTVQAAAYKKAGDQIRWEDLYGAARMLAMNSAVPEVRAMVDAPDDEKQMAAWCEKNLPEVTASPVAKPSPKKTTAKPKPKPKKTTKKPAPVEEPDPVRDVTPGAFCSPAGAIGTHNGRTYTCKGPGQARWRR